MKATCCAISPSFDARSIRLERGRQAQPFLQRLGRGLRRSIVDDIMNQRSSLAGIFAVLTDEIDGAPFYVRGVLRWN